MRLWPSLPLVLASSVALAGPAPVIGGTNAPAGKWPDAAAIYYLQTDGTDQQECSGTLVAPTVVLTAGHCDTHIDASIGMLDHVLLGTTSLARPQDGELLGVSMFMSYPNSQSTIDVTAIVLSQPARETPRPIATGWAKFDIVNGAPVEFVGYGAIDKNANTYIDDLQQAQSTITDFDCTMMPGCNAAARPDGELGAGGMGIDTCPGDSGGPMYLLADYGTFLAGVTSRSYDNATYYCSEGGIYGRPDKIVDWIEMVTGARVARGPEPTAAPLMAVRGHADETKITANDPKAKDHTFAITTPPMHGTAAIRDDGTLRVCTDPAMAGTDSVVVTVTDKANPMRAVAITVPITIEDGAAASSCDPSAFSEGGGCCDAGRNPAGAIPLSIVVLLVLRRRR